MDVGVHEISNVHPVRDVLQLICGRYRASRHKSKKSDRWVMCVVWAVD